MQCLRVAVITFLTDRMPILNSIGNVPYFVPGVKQTKQPLSL